MNGDFNFFSVPKATGGIKLPVCLILDTSGSMSETIKSSRGMVVKIDELNNNIDTLLQTIKNGQILFMFMYGIVQQINIKHLGQELPLHM